jgi:DNA polymerase III epsilon subunit family exonuclease
MTTTNAQQTPPLFHFPQPGGSGQPLAELPLAVVDVETTGFNPGADRVVEVAIVRMSPSGVVEEQFVSLVDPGRDVGPTWVHQITDDMVAGAPTFGDIAGDVLELLDGAVAVAHNASFDGGFLGFELAHAGIRSPSVPAACTMQLARWSRLDVPNFKLATCCEALGLTNSGAHSALGDALVTAQLASRLMANDLDLRWATGPSPLPRPPRRAIARLRP